MLCVLATAGLCLGEAAGRSSVDGRQQCVWGFRIRLVFGLVVFRIFFFDFSDLNLGSRFKDL